MRGVEYEELEDLEEETRFAARAVCEVSIICQLQLVEVDHAVQVLVHLPNELVNLFAMESGSQSLEDGVQVAERDLVVHGGVRFELVLQLLQTLFGLEVLVQDEVCLRLGHSLRLFALTRRARGREGREKTILRLHLQQEARAGRQGVVEAIDFSFLLFDLRLNCAARGVSGEVIVDCAQCAFVLQRESDPLARRELLHHLFPAFCRWCSGWGRSRQRFAHFLFRDSFSFELKPFRYSLS